MKTILNREFLEIIANGENSLAEFKQDDVQSEQLAKEIVALSHGNNRKHLVGFEDNLKIILLRIGPENELDKTNITMDDPINDLVTKVNDPITAANNPSNDP